LAPYLSANLAGGSINARDRINGLFEPFNKHEQVAPHASALASLLAFSIA
jgi:hypothetical protein